MKNKYVIIIFLVMIVLVFSSCGKSKPPTENDIKKDSVVTAYFDSLGMEIKKVTLEKRQTYDEQKSDSAYCYIEAENDNAYIKNQFVITSSYYDEGGWMIEGIYPVEGNNIEPKRYPEIEVSSTWCKVLELEPTIIDTYTYVYNYECVYKGEYLTCIVPCHIECKFDKKTGIWTYWEKQDQEIYNYVDFYARYQGRNVSLMLGVEKEQMYLTMYSDDSMYEDGKHYYKINTYEGIVSSFKVNKGEISFVLNGEKMVSELTEF